MNRAATIIAVGVALTVGCGSKSEAPAKSGRHALVFTVDAMPVEAKRVDYVVQAPGTIDAFERVQVTARVAGAVDRVLFSEGQSVKRGATLVTIDAERYALAVAQAKAALEKAKATEADAEAMVARREGATADHPGLIPGEEIGTNRTHVLTAKADVEVAVEALKMAQANLRDSSVVAPIEGVIQTRTIETGQFVQPGYVMATLLRSDPMLLHFQVVPDDAPRLKPGMIATFSMRETQRTFQAKLTLVSGSADAATHMIGVTGEVIAGEHRYWLRPGSFCNVTLDLGAQRDAPVIPRSAARATDHGYVAFVVDGEVVKEHPLTLGMSTRQGWVEVRSGLKAGDQLVVRGAEPLSNGAAVRANKVTPESLGGGASDGEHPMNITDVSIKNPVFAWMLMMGTVLFGVISITRVGISQYPDVDYPNVSVSVSWPGASPSAVEREILQPIEQALAQVEGVQTIQAQARQGSARITCSFDISRNVDLALQDVQAKVAQTQRSLPADVPAATVSKSNPDDVPIVTVGVYGPFARQLLSDVAKYQVQEKLQTVAGVGQIQLNGYLDRNIRIWLDTERMNERGVVVSDVIGSIQKQHVEMPGGLLDTSQRQLNVRLLGEAIDLDDLKKLVIRKVNDAPVHLEDIALVEDGFEDVNTLAQLDGEPLQALGILKQRGTNAVAVAQAIREKVAEIQHNVPDGMKVEVLADTTTFIKESVNEIELELCLALLLTAFVCWLFLGSLSSTLNVVLAIPMSLLGTIAVVSFLGFTLNTFTLLGLSLAVGLVVDDAVMVMENIYRHAEMGKSRAVAASDGTKEITTAALAATLAVIAIFLPVIFMKGIIGRFFFQFGVTLSVAVLLSYFEAITLAPARCAQILNASREGRGRVGRAVDGAFVSLEKLYGRLLALSLARPGTVLIAGVVLLAASLALIPAIPTEFIPSQDQSQLNVRIQTETGTSIAAAKPLIDRAEQLLAKRAEVARILSTLTGTTGSMTLTLVAPNQRKLSAQQLSQELRKQLSGIAGIRATVQDPSQQGFGVSKGYPIDFTVRGSDWDTLVKVSMKLKDDLEKSGVTTDLSTDYQVGAPEVQMTPDRRRANDLGISMADLGNAVSTLIGGNIVGKFSVDGRRIDMRMRLMATQRTRPEDLGAIRMRTQGGDTVPMSLVVTQKETAVLQTINRLDRERAIGITGNVAPGHSQQEVMAYVDSLARELPSGYHTVASGQASQLAETTGGLFFALAIGILVAYMVLASQFNSLLHPVTVLTILPLAISGAAIGLFLSGKSLNIFSMIGVLLLMGIVKKNSILLVEYANHVREHDRLDALAAMRKAGPLRLRPILMTTVATMMSAVPAILGLGPGTETRSPMAAVVLGGLTVSTLLSLLVVPAFYVVADRARAKLRGQPIEPPVRVQSGGE